MFAVLSPAKKLDLEPLSAEHSSQLEFTCPSLVDETEKLIDETRKLRATDLRQLMKLSETLAELNFNRFQEMSLPITEKNGRPAVLTFDGDTYQGFGAPTLSVDDLRYAQANLGILSGLYGILRPLDLMQPYRLEMGTRLKNKRGNNLYSFWGDRITETINDYLRESDSSTLVNLASNEYFKSVSPKKITGTVITPHFKEIKNKVPKVVGFYAKRARGMMARYMIQNRLRDPEKLKSFNDGGYKFDCDLSDSTNWVFTRESK